MIKVDKDDIEANGTGLTLVSELALAVDEIAKALGISHKDILTTIDRAIDRALDDANLS